MRQRELDEREAAVQVELLADVGAVCLDRARADEEFGGNLFARFVVGDGLQYAPFHRREVVQAGLFRAEHFGAAATMNPPRALADGVSHAGHL